MSFTYGPVLSPDDPAISSKVKGWWSVADPNCFADGVLPSEGADVTTLYDKSSGGINMTRVSGSNIKYYGNVEGQPCLRVTASQLSATDFFGDGTGWGNEFAVVTLVRVPNTTNTQQNNALRSGAGSFNISFNRDNATGRGFLPINGTNEYSRAGWIPLVLAYRMGSPITVSGATQKRNKAFLDGSIYTGPTTPTPTGYLQINGGSGAVDFSELVAIQGSLTWTEVWRLGRWLMESRSIPRRTNTVVFIGNSTTEHGNIVPCFETYAFNDHGEEMETEFINMAVSGGGTTTWGTLEGDVQEVFDDLEAQDRLSAAHLWVGHNDGGWGTAVQDTYENYLAFAREYGHRLVCTGVTPGSYTTSSLQNHDNWLQTAVPTYADDVIRPFLTEWADVSPHDSPTVDGDAVFSDNVHFTLKGYETIAKLYGPTIINQLRVARAVRAIAAAGEGEVTLTRHETDPSLADLTLRLVPANSAAPTTEDTPVLTLEAGVSSVSEEIEPGEYDAYVSANNSTPVFVSTLEVESGSPSDTTPPEVEGAAVSANGLSLLLEMSEGVSPTTGITGFSVKVDGVSVSVSSSSASGSTITLTLGSVVYSGKSVTVSYVPGNVVDGSSNALAAFADLVVTNSSTVEEPEEEGPPDEDEVAIYKRNVYNYKSRSASRRKPSPL